ncbi:enoyl-CoA hydratase/isomerase family protein [Blastococcus sp. SYSU D00820]
MSLDDPLPPTAPTPVTGSVRSGAREGVGHLVLDRPEALNALDTAMVQALDAALAGWAGESGMRRVVLESSSARAFCAGGDIRAVRERALAGDTAGNREFFGTEYRLDRRIAEYPLPHVSLVQGACMGGGLGVSVHGSHRVATGTAVLAMPETGIGFFPDIGATWFLPRLPGHLGVHLGLTGARLTAEDALYCGLITHLVPAERLPDLRTGLADPAREVADVLDALAVWPGGRRVRPPGDDPVWRAVSRLADAREAVDAVWSAPDLAAVLDRLAARSDDWSAETLAALHRASPASLHVTWALLRAPQPSLAASLDRELQVALAVTGTPDFAEGVRAALVDRDRSPRWDPAVSLTDRSADVLAAVLNTLDRAPAV